MGDASLVMLGALLVLLWMTASVALRGACRLSRVPKPGFAGAATLVLVVGAITAAVQFGMGMLLGAADSEAKIDSMLASRLLVGVGVPLHMLIAASLYKMMLPTTFGKAMSVWIVQMILVLSMALVACAAVHAVSPDGWQQLRELLGG